MMEERFNVVYHLTGTEAEAMAKARTICLEQTVEVGAELVPQGFDQIVGHIEQVAALATGYAVTISYAVTTSAYELTQLLNVVFGNSSIKAGIKVHQLHLSKSLLARFPGPQFGIKGLREQVGVANAPLLCTALKPMGKTTEELAHLAYQLALGGLDIIKDDHGLTNQPFCPYHQRVAACAAAVQRANQETGYRCIYVPNVTAPMTEIESRAYYAKQAGAGGLLLAPGLTGFDALRVLAERIALPVIAHPALLGSLVNGFAHGVLLGQLPRLAGADATIYPNYQGRFSFTQAQCQSIADACREPLGNYPSIFPMPGGGMSLESVPEMLALYGQEVIFLIGGALYAHSPNLVENVRYFLSLVGR